MKPVWHKSRRYSLFRIYVDLTTRLSFRRTSIVGKENIPADGAVLLAPNHCNTLMDALVVLRARRDATAFGARADIFKKDYISSVLYFLRILPVPRMRDGADQVLANHELVDRATETLEHDVPFCLFVEGTHRTKHSLQPIKKGIFRMALNAVKKLDKTVYILPVGLEYGDYFHYRTTSLMSYGKPINVNQVIADHPGATEHEIYTVLTEMLRERMTELISYVPYDEHYNEVWNQVEAAKNFSYDTLEHELHHTQELIRRASAGEKLVPRKFPVLSRILFCLAALVGLPFFLFWATVSCPMWITAEILCHNVKDKAFRNTVRYGVRFVLYPLMLIVWALVAFLNFKWYVALGLFVLCIPSYSWFYDYVGFVRDIILHK